MSLIIKWTIVECFSPFLEINKLDFWVSQNLPFSEYDVKRVGEWDSGASDEKNGGNVSLGPTISWHTLPPSFSRFSRPVNRPQDHRSVTLHIMFRIRCTLFLYIQWKRLLSWFFWTTYYIFCVSLLKLFHEIS